MQRFGMHGKIMAAPGKRDDLVQLLMDGTKIVGEAPGCELYYVSVSNEEPDAIWVMEIWRSKQDHDDSLKIPAIREIIAKARPLIAGGVAGVHTVPVGGVGIRNS